MKTSERLKLVLSFAFFYFSAPSFAETATVQQPTEVACRYQINITPQPKSETSANHDWLFWRKPGLIQTQNASGDYGEIWQKTVTGNIQYRKLYHADKTAVEYMPADMPTNDLSFDWLKLSNMLSQQELDALKTVKKTHVLGHNAELRKGKIDDQTIEVIWLPSENLPASIVKKNKTSRMELRLVEITPLATARRQPISLEEIANYRHIDAADFGDMENDPFVKKVMRAEGHAHH